MAFNPLYSVKGRRRKRLFLPLQGPSLISGGQGSIIYNGGTASTQPTAYADLLNGQNATFTSWTTRIIPSSADGTYPNVEA